MPDPLFRRSIFSLPLAAVAAHGAAELPPGADPAMPILGVASLAAARSDELAVADDAEAAADLRATRAGACLVPPALLADVPAGTVALVTPNPLRAFLAVAALVDPETRHPASWPGDTARHPSAIVHPSARIEPGAALGPGVVVGPDAEIGAGTSLGPSCVVEGGVRIGRRCAIGPQVTFSHALVGDRVVVHAGARIGVIEAGTARLGRAIVQDGVEIGANAVIARGAWRDTVIGEGAVVEATACVRGDAIVARYAIVPAAAP